MAGLLFDCQKFAVSENFGEVFSNQRRDFLDRFSATRLPTVRQNLFISIGRSAPFSIRLERKTTKEEFTDSDGNCLQIFQRIWL